MNEPSADHGPVMPETPEPPPEATPSTAPPPEAPPQPPPTAPPYAQPAPGAQQYDIPFAARYGLIRPRDDRYLAGVCSAIGRATKTDPILWRVILAVLVLFGGTGLVVYLAGWMLTPSEGDTASPLEAVLGRGQSGTSPTVVVVIGTVVAITLMMAVISNSKAGVLGLIVIGGIAIWLARRDQQHPNVRNTFGEVPMVFQPPGETAPPAGEPSATPGAKADQDATVVLPDGGTPSHGAPTLAGEPLLPPRPPLTPHGPYASNPYATPPGYPFQQTSPVQYPGYGPPPGGLVPAKRRERSILGRLTVSVICLAMGVLVAVDLSGAHLGAPAYVGTALGVVATGLLVGTWLGRARGLIALGIALSIALGITVASEDWEGPRGSAQTYTPMTAEAIQQRYQLDVGNVILDLTQVDFTGKDVNVEVFVEVGDLEIRLPATVDTDLTATISLGGGDVFGTSWGGLGGRPRETRDLGIDGAGGGHITITARVEMGHLEVSR